MNEPPRDFDTGIRPSELDPGFPRPIDTPWGSFTIWRLASGRLVARESFCPHLLGPLFQGSRYGDVLACPWHDWHFSLETGACVFSPRGEGAHTHIRALEVEVGAGGTLVLSPRTETA